MVEYQTRKNIVFSKTCVFEKKNPKVEKTFTLKYLDYLS